MVVAIVTLACVRIVDPHRAALRYYSEQQNEIYLFMRGIEVVLLAACVYPLKSLVSRQARHITNIITSRAKPDPAVIQKPIVPTPRPAS
jgi:hypothetical protein